MTAWSQGRRLEVAGGVGEQGRHGRVLRVAPAKTTDANVECLNRFSDSLSASAIDVILRAGASAQQIAVSDSKHIDGPDVFMVHGAGGSVLWTKGTGCRRFPLRSTA